MQAPARWAAMATAAVACVTLAGCSASTSSGGSAANSPAPIATVPPSGGAGSVPGSMGKLTGNFCADAQDVGDNIHIPPGAMSSLSAMQKTGVKYLNELATYLNGLAAEAPGQVGNALRILAADYQRVASAVTSGNISSLTKVEQQVQSLTSSGTAANAFGQLVSYMVRNCK